MNTGILNEMYPDGYPGLHHIGPGRIKFRIEEKRPSLLFRQTYFTWKI